MYNIPSPGSNNRSHCGGGSSFWARASDYLGRNVPKLGVLANLWRRIFNRDDGSLQMATKKVALKCRILQVKDNELGRTFQVEFDDGDTQRWPWKQWFQIADKSRTYSQEEFLRVLSSMDIKRPIDPLEYIHGDSS